MTNSAIKKMLSKCGIPENTWIHDERLHKIILTGDGNIFIGTSDIVERFDKNLDQLWYYFDTTNNLLKTKKYTRPFLISNRINKKICSITETTIEYKKGNNIYQRFRGFESISEPVVGDKVITLNSDLAQEKVVEIIDREEIDGKIKLTLSGKITTAGIIVLAKKKFYEHSTANSADGSIITYSEPYDDLPFDSLISFDFLGGIEFTRNL